MPGARAALSSRQATIGNKKGPVCAQQFPGALPGSSTQGRTLRAPLPGAKPSLSQVPKGQQEAERTLKPPVANIRPPALGRTPRSSGRRKGKSEAGLRHPSSCCPYKTIPLLWDWVTTGPPLLRTRQSASLQSLSPSRQLPRGPRPRAGPTAPSAPWGAPHSIRARGPTRRASETALQLLPGEGARLRQEVRRPLTL